MPSLISFQICLVMTSDQWGKTCLDEVDWGSLISAKGATGLT